MSIAGLLVAPPALVFLRKLIRRVRNIAQTAVHRHHAHHRDHAGSVARHAHGQGLLARGRDAATARRKRHRGRASSQQDGASRLSRQPADGDARRLCDRAGDDVRRLPGDRWRRDAGRIHFLPGGVSARLRAGQAAGAAQHRLQQQSRRRPRPLRGHRQPGGRAEGRRPPAAQARDRTPRIRRRELRLSPRRTGAARHELSGTAGQADGPGGPVGRRQIDGARSDPALL